MIKITQRYRLFSHTPGAECLIPGADCVVQAFPTLVRLGESEVPLEVTGPVKEFTLEQDLERDRVRVFGRAREGHFCHTFESEEKVLDFERLSFGVHKQLDWDLVLRRNQLSEILPLLFVLGQKYKGKVTNYYQTQEELEALMTAGFRGILVPVRKDERYLGVELDEMDPMLRLRKSYESIRRLFILEEEGIHVLPNLLKPFHAGRMTGIVLENCKLDLEWTKRKIRRVNIVATKSGLVKFHWPKEVKNFRVRRNPRERGVVVSMRDSIEVEEGKRYFLDKFQK